MRLLTFALLLMTILAMPARAAEPFDMLAKGGAGGWLNVKRPLTAADMEGRFVLLDFWTYGCINCMQIVPELEALEHEFGDRLLIIGVHSAKFEGEKESSRIRAAAKRFGLKHPVLNDSDFAVWKAFDVKAWPTLVLLGPGGQEIGRYAGEGNGPKLAADIRASQTPAQNTAPLTDLVEQGSIQETLAFPARLATDGARLFIADTGHHRILITDIKGTIQTVIGSGTPGFKDGGFKVSQFKNPRGIAVQNGILYIADTENHAIRKVDLATGAVTTVIGTGRKGAPLSSPWDVEFLAGDKTLAIANAGSHQLMTLDTGTGKLSVLAGSGLEELTDGTAKSASLAQPSGLSRIDGSLYFVDAESSSLRVLKNDIVITLIGRGLFHFGMIDGLYPNARLQHPQGLYADNDRVWIADTYNNAIRSFDRRVKFLKTIRLPGGTLSEPGDIIMIGDQVYIADTNHNRIVTLNPATGKTAPLNVVFPTVLR